MFGRSAVVDVAETNVTLSRTSLSKPSELASTVFLSASCGLLAGLIEVGTIVVRKTGFDDNHLYDMSRHFVWLIPVTNLGIFTALAILGWVLNWAWPRRGRWLFTRGLCAITLLPAFLIAFPRVYSVAWLVVTLGMAMRLVPILESYPRRFQWAVQVGSLLAVGILLYLGGSIWVNDQIKRSRESARPMPPPGSPNILLIILDTVAAGHLSLYGYERPTSTTLIELSERGIRFDSARTASSWTLPSHAIMFTGRWMHELSVGWLNPLDGTRPTLAEYLGERGYATTGFVANTTYCASNTGLDRGFTQYQDFVFPECTALKSAILANRVLAVLGWFLPIVEERSSLAWLRPYLQWIWRSFVFDRKRADTVNREFLDWLSRRTEPRRPFFAFLNYSDAHVPYELADGRVHRFGLAQLDVRQRELITHWGELDKAHLAQADRTFVVDAYDDCMADLDEQIGRLVDKLRRQGIMDRTWLIIASDHGESFGEHPGVFCHGTSLYQTELHVPLLIVPPGGAATKHVVKETVSLRDLAATIVDLLGLGAGAPFPGRSLARYWRDPSPADTSAKASADPALAEVVPNLASNVDAYGLPQKSWPLGALDDGEWSYIRREVNVREELFRLSKDVKEQHNLAGDPGAQPILERMRKTLLNLTGGPLMPERFNR